jgi:hypothetical protein
MSSLSDVLKSKNSFKKRKELVQTGMVLAAKVAKKAKGPDISCGYFAGFDVPAVSVILSSGMHKLRLMPTSAPLDKPDLLLSISLIVSLPNRLTALSHRAMQAYSYARCFGLSDLVRLKLRKPLEHRDFPSRP